MARFRIKQFTVHSADKFFFDTNVWLFLFSPFSMAKDKKQEAYSNILQDITRSKSTIWTSSLVISEYINASLKIAFRQWMSTQDAAQSRQFNLKKDFRPTMEYNTILSDIKNQVNDILSIAKRCPDDFDSLDIYKILSDMGNDCEFNDSCIADCCQRWNYKLVSDDRDMYKFSDTLTIISD